MIVQRYEFHPLTVMWSHLQWSQRCEWDALL